MSFLEIILLVLSLASTGGVVFLITQLRSFKKEDGGQDQKVLIELFSQMQHSVREEIGQNRQEFLENDRRAREEQGKVLSAFSDSSDKRIADLTKDQQRNFELFSRHLVGLIENNDQRMEKVRETIEGRLEAIQKDNGVQLEKMRVTVDEKLNTTLERRLGESFKMVSERLDIVHKGLGEMQNLAVGVGDLKKVLQNVKTRGTWGEVQLGNLLEQMLTPAQFERDVMVRPDSRERVDFAIKLPSKDDDEVSEIWLPIDAKFPIEDYERLIDASERGDKDAVDIASKALRARIQKEAASIAEKYIVPPYSTDFAILYLPLEGLYAEILRHPDFAQKLQRDYRITLAGPMTISAILNSLQMGFRSLAIQESSSEVWKVLATVKDEFGKFGAILEKTKKQLQAVSNTMDTAASKSRTLERKLRKVEELPAGKKSSEEAIADMLPADDILPLE